MSIQSYGSFYFRDSRWTDFRLALTLLLKPEDFCEFDLRKERSGI